MLNKIKEYAHHYFQDTKKTREHIHAHPELSFEEYETSKYICSKLDEYGIPYNTGYAGTGIIATIKGEGPGNNFVAIRGELDALPIKELTEVPHKSCNDGIMHACGHDVHSSCVLTTGRILNELRSEWGGTVMLIFQPGEEKHPGGGSLILAEGVFSLRKPDAIFALHVYPHLPAGTVGFREGKYMASTDEIHVQIKGKGGHAALPHTTIDPIAIAAQVIVNLQQLVSRKSNPVIPCVLSFGMIQGGKVNNVIPDFVTFSGTLRTMDEAWRTEAHTLIRTIIHNTCDAFGATATVDIPKGYPSLFNDPLLTAGAVNHARIYLGEEHVKQLDLRMTADDFAYYSQEFPGCYFRLGTNANGSSKTASVHNALFDIEDKAMETGSGLLTWLVYQRLMS